MVKTLRVEPTSKSKRVCLFPYQDTILYTCIPKDWDIRIVFSDHRQTSHPVRCPSYEQHLLIDFLERFIHACSFRLQSSRLSQLLTKLLEEIKFDCSFCKQYNHDLKRFSNHSYLSLFITSTLNASIHEEDIQNIIEIHDKNISFIKHQSRSDKVLERIISHFQSLVETSFQQFQSDPSKIEDIKSQLYRQLQDYLLKTIPFFNMKSSPLMEWIEHLFLLKCYLTDIPRNNQTVISFLKKIILLFQLFFQETKEVDLDNTYYWMSTPIIHSQSPLQLMYEYHPLVRGTFFSSIIPKHLLTGSYTPKMIG